MADLIVGLAWPLLALFGGCVFFRPLHRTMIALATNIEAGAEFKAGGVSVGARPPNQAAVTKALEVASTPPKDRTLEDLKAFSFDGSDDLLSEANIALFHTSFRYDDRHGRFRGQKMFQIEIIVLAPDDVLNQIEKVKYVLAAAYPRRIYEVGVEARGTRFKLKELANGYSIVRAEIKFKGKHEALLLNRFIDLVDQPRLD